ncbi:MAG: sortase [bacterium]|nr:sortase [bacterium]
MMKPFMKRLANMAQTLPATDRGLLFAFLLAAAAVGHFTFFAGRGAQELLTAPRYRPTFPAAATVSPALYQARLARVRASDSAPAPTQAVVKTHEGGNWIRVPALSLNLPLALAPTLNTEDVLRTLRVGVVRYPNGVAPGQRGVVVIAGHSTGEPWKGPYRFAFLHAGKLRPGDVMYVDHNGSRYTYRVTGQRLITPRSTPFLDSTADQPRLSIISCWPIWTTQQRLVVDAELAETARLAVQPRGAS